MSDSPREASYFVPGMSCGHCVAAITEEVGSVTGVTAVNVDLETKLVHVTATTFDDNAVRAAIEEAGFEVVVP
jgi:copper chaperone